MSDFYFWFIVYGKIINFFIATCTITGILSSVFFCIFIFYFVELNGIKEYLKKEYKKLSDLFRKLFIIFISCFIFIIFILCIKPEKQEIMTYYIIKKIEVYNSENQNSNFNPDNILKNFDNSITKISELSSLLINKLQNKIEEKNE